MMLVVRLLLGVVGMLLSALGGMLVVHAVSHKNMAYTVAITLLGCLLFVCGTGMIILGGYGLYVLAPWIGG